MTELLTAAQMRAIEAAAIASGSVTGLELMERAGRGVVDAIFAEWPELQAGSFRAVVLCGPGNNGGDGFVVARLLKEWGWQVEVFLHGTPEGMPPDARVNYERWVGMGAVVPLTEDAFRKTHPVHGSGYADLYVDAIFGAGLTRTIEGDLASLLRHLGGSGGESYPRLVAIDAPSGLCMDSGKVLGAQKSAQGMTPVPYVHLTVTFECAKLGHYLENGPRICGRLTVRSIGIEQYRKTMAGTLYHDRTRTDLGVRQIRLANTLLVGLAPGIREPTSNFDRLSDVVPGGLIKGDDASAHKFDYGHALVLSGGKGRGGAARMSARAALRIGAGLVTLCCPPDALTENAARVDAIMLRPLLSAARLAGVLVDRRINALCVGPGLGVVRAAGMLRVALGGGGVKSRPTVIDADGLTALAGDAALFAALHPACVLTPHAGEFARLFSDIAARLDAPATTGPAYSKVDATRDAAKRAGCVVVFKGPDTVIADPSGRCSINSAAYDRAAPWLATAGSGDVLAGFICGLLARGFAPMQAAETAAWLHVECARSFGPGLIAEDLPEELPKVFRALGL